MSTLPDRDHPNDDPRLWLEDIEGERALAWVDAETRKTLARFGDARFEADRDALASIMDRPDKIPFVTRRGAELHNFWVDAAHPRGLWRRTSIESYATAEPEWEILLDVDALAAAEGEDWIWQGATSLPGTHDSAMLRLSRGGSDAAVLREFDLTTNRFVENGFALPAAKQSVAWLDRDTLLVASTLGDGHATTSGYARTVRWWRRGTAFEDAPTVYEIDASHMALDVQVDRAVAPLRVWYIDRTAFFDAVVHLGDATGAKERIDLPSDALWLTHGAVLVLKPRFDWVVGGATYPADCLYGLELDAVRRGEIEPVLLFEKGPRVSLEGFFFAAGTLHLAILDDLRPRFRAFGPSDGTWTEVAPPAGLASDGVAQLWKLDSETPESDGTLLSTSEDPLSPMSLSVVRPGVAPIVLKRNPDTFDATGLVVSRHEVTAADGERVPYVQVGPAEVTGAAPVLMYGYGGFDITMQPHYRSAVGKLWLEKGGTYVLTHIRGGGEFGTRWHEIGRREGKARSHDDFAAIASDLVARGVTTPGRIVAEGGSNGGILISNMLTRYPERFGALFCTIPLIDMRRYTKLLAGASWIAEYGDPDKPEDWAFLQHISAYHAAGPGRPYPPILLATTRKDDRVHPGHARKMAAKLQELGYSAHYYEPAAGGHGYGKDNKERAAFTALGYAFLRRAIGWESEKAS
jgi:prolyl oligopeptidase